MSITTQAELHTTHVGCITASISSSAPSLSLSLHQLHPHTHTPSSPAQLLQNDLSYPRVWILCSSGVAFWICTGRNNAKTERVRICRTHRLMELLCVLVCARSVEGACVWWRRGQSGTLHDRCGWTRHVHLASGEGMYRDSGEKGGNWEEI